MFRKATMRVGLTILMLTSDEPTTSQAYVLKLPGCIFMGNRDEVSKIYNYSGWSILYARHTVDH